MTYIIESIHANGLKTTPAIHRLETPKSGDIVDCSAIKGACPFYHDTARIQRVEDEEVNLCCEMGSAFLRHNGDVDISGGPFTIIERSRLTPARRTSVGLYWNWGDHSPGPDQGVHYHIARPTFVLEPEPIEHYVIQVMREQAISPPLYCDHPLWYSVPIFKKARAYGVAQGYIQSSSVTQIEWTEAGAEWAHRWKCEQAIEKAAKAAIRARRNGEDEAEAVEFSLLNARTKRTPELLGQIAERTAAIWRDTHLSKEGGMQA